MSRGVRNPVDIEVWTELERIESIGTRLVRIEPVKGLDITGALQSDLVSNG